MDSVLLAQIIFAVFSFILGSILGSFLLVVTSRMGVKSLNGRSKCDACATQIENRDLIPIASYLMLKGRCRACKSRIPALTFWIEVMMGFSFAIHSMVAQDVVTLITGFIVISLCAVLAVYDFRTHFLPSKYLWVLTSVAIIYRMIIIPDGITHTLWGYFYLVMPALLLMIIVLASRERLMGIGDPILLFALALIIGTWQGALLTLLIASWGGLLYVVWVGIMEYIQNKKVMSKKRIAFGPGLILGFLISWWLSIAGFVVFV